MPSNNTFRGSISSAQFFAGFSLGSILLVVALGLAITFGLMGVINMAHGEMIAVGAYTCYVVQNIFGTGFGFSINLPFQRRRPSTRLRHASPRLERHGLVLRKLFSLRVAVEFFHGGARRTRHRTNGDSFSVSPPAGIVAGHLGRFAHHAAMFPHGVRRE